MLLTLVPLQCDDLKLTVRRDANRGTAGDYGSCPPLQR